MFNPRTASPAERAIYLEGVRRGLEFGRKFPDTVPKALEIAELELQLAFSA
jgi:hypothetical protein